MSLGLLPFLFLGCARAPATPPEPAPHISAPAFEPVPLVRDPARGGPPVHRSAAPLPPFQGVSRATATYVGEATCGSCHSEPAVAWRQSAHAHAYETLQAQQKAFDPSCLRCHVVGLGHPGGFQSAAQSPELMGVGCESCHGPGSDHVASPGPGYGALPRGPASCQGCHSVDNSPDFNFEGYWARVAH